MPLALLAVLTPTLIGCPPVEPPFDATGDYAGTWEGVEETTGETVASPITFTLEQDLTLEPPQHMAVEGDVVIEFAGTALGDLLENRGDPTSVTVKVGGLVGKEGNLVLASGGCATFLCLLLTFGGPGDDTGSDGFMDAYSGDWTLTVAPIGINAMVFRGTFSATRM
jgi:hypothetical protein